MTATIRIDDEIEIPAIGSLADFRRWSSSAWFPEEARIDYVAGQIEVEMSPEDLHTHGTPKTELVVVIGSRVRAADLGELYIDRARVSCPQADLSAEPDIVFVAHAALETGRVRLVPKATTREDRYAELEGPPDLIAEIVSDSSARKDARRLFAAYWEAGVGEYWLVDARTDDLLFRIHHRGPAGYEPVPAREDGFQYSAVLDCWFLLQRGRNRYGRLKYTLLEDDSAAAAKHPTQGESSPRGSGQGEGRSD